MDPHVEKPCGDGYHANGQSDSEVWQEPPMEPAEPRRSRLSFSDTYVEILDIEMCRCHDKMEFQMGAGDLQMCFIPVIRVVSVRTLALLIHVPFQQVLPLPGTCVLFTPLYKSDVGCWSLIKRSIKLSPSSEICK